MNASPHITPRAHETLALICQGLSNKQIADRLGVSNHTAKFHVAQATAALGALNRAHAAAIYTTMAIAGVGHVQPAALGGDVRRLALPEPRPPRPAKVKAPRILKRSLSDNGARDRNRRARRDIRHARHEQTLATLRKEGLDQLSVGVIDGTRIGYVHNDVVLVLGVAQ